MDGLLTIGELARRAGVTTSALRYYEELGLLPAPARVSGQRRYPVVEFEDGGVYREESADMAARIRAGELSEADRPADAAG